MACGAATRLVKKGVPGIGDSTKGNETVNEFVRSLNERQFLRKCEGFLLNERDRLFIRKGGQDYFSFIVLLKEPDERGLSQSGRWQVKMRYSGTD